MARPADKNIDTRMNALDEYVPTIPENFWRILRNKPRMYVAESHLMLWHLISKYPECDIVSLDAHHDCGYAESRISRIESSNWAEAALRFGFINSLKLYYPEWRRDLAEGVPKKEPTAVKFGLPRRQSYDLVFVCRSGAWTPPWYDPEFWEFVTVSGLKIKQMEEMKAFREPSMEMAKELRVKLTEQFASLLNNERRPNAVSEM